LFVRQSLDVISARQPTLTAMSLLSCRGFPGDHLAIRAASRVADRARLGNVVACAGSGGLIGLSGMSRFSGGSAWKVSGSFRKPEVNSLDFGRYVWPFVVYAANQIELRVELVNLPDTNCHTVYHI
jgi:hypothetical protein